MMIGPEPMIIIFDMSFLFGIMLDSLVYSFHHCYELIKQIA